MALTVDVVGPAPWGFRISGGRDFHTPIMVTKVSASSRRWGGAPRVRFFPVCPVPTDTFLFFFFLFWSQGLLLRLLAGVELGPGCHEDMVATSRE